MKMQETISYFVMAVRRKGVGQICVGHINIEINKVSNTVYNPFLHVELQGLVGRQFSLVILFFDDVLSCTCEMIYTAFMFRSCSGHGQMMVSFGIFGHVHSWPVSGASALYPFFYTAPIDHLSIWIHFQYHSPS